VNQDGYYNKDSREISQALNK